MLNSIRLTLLCLVALMCGTGTAVFVADARPAVKKQTTTSKAKKKKAAKKKAPAKKAAAKKKAPVRKSGAAAKRSAAKPAAKKSPARKTTASGVVNNPVSGEISSETSPSTGYSRRLLPIDNNLAFSRTLSKTSVHSNQKSYCG